MRTLITGLALAVFCSAALAQVPGLSNAEVEDRTIINDPAKAVSKTGSGWIAMEIAAIDGTRSPCCWQGNWTSQREIGCSLDKDFRSYGSTSDSPFEESVVVYARAIEGQVSQLRVTGAQCPMDAAGQTVTWVGETDDKDALNWLATLASESKERVSHAALWAMALHASSEAGDHLYTMARDDVGELAEEAIFWLGEARGQAGYEALDELLDVLPAGETRRHINFALAQNGSNDAIERLFDTARNDHDPEQRSMAMFWLAQEQQQEARELLLEVVQSENDEDVLDQAVFAISQLPAETGSPMLLDLASDKDASRHVRRQALFWLAQSGDDEAIAQLTELLTR